MTVFVQAFWGLLGGLLFGAPRLSACVYARNKLKQSGEDYEPIAQCWAEFGIALVTGGVLAGGFGELVANRLHEPNIAAIALIIGIVSNPIAPVVEVLRHRFFVALGITVENK